MYKIDAYKTSEDAAIITPLQVKRDWMELTHERHAYSCFPVTLTNSLGFGLSFPEDIVFMWDGSSDARPEHVKILSGHKYAYTERANATISFKTGLVFRTEENVSLLGMPTPNMFLDGAYPFTTAISTSWYEADFPVAWRITKPGVAITIPAGYPVITVLPISLSNINESEVTLRYKKDMPPSKFSSLYNETDHIKIVSEYAVKKEWTNFYRNAVDYLGNKLGKHEVKSIRLKVIDNAKN
jgi:hypothetical protein